MSKKIFFLTDNFPPEHNAAASRVYERGVYWAKSGHELTVLTSFPNFPDGKVFGGYKNQWYLNEDIEKIKVHRVKTFIAPNKRIILRVVDFLSYMVTSFVAGLFLIKKEHEVVVSTSPQFFTAISAWALAKIKNKPYIFELGDLWPESIKAVGVLNKSWPLKLIEKLELFLYREACTIIALTEAFKVNLVERGIDPNKIHVVRNGVDLTLHYKRPKNTELIKRHNLENKFVVGYVGTHGLAHDLHRILDAAEIMQTVNPNVVFMFVGTGASRKKLIKYAETKKLTNVVFVGPQPKEVVCEYWGLLSLALVHLKNSPAFSSVIPSKIFESMAYELPVLLVSPKGEAADIVTSVGNGIVLSDYDLNTFVKTVDMMSKNEKLCDEFKQKAKAASSDFTRKKQAELFMNAIVNCIPREQKDVNINYSLER